MYPRFLFWVFLCALVAAAPLRAQVPQPEPGLNDPMPEGTVLVAKVNGKVTKTLNGVVTDLVANAKVEQKAKINTGPNSSAVLVFSNGASTRLEADTELIVEEFLQDPFATEIKVSTLEREPTASRTKLFLNKGEIVGEVKTLKPGGRAAFTVQTPVGAAGIRGTIFRIVFRPSGTGQAFFTLSTVTGQVNFDANSQGGGTVTTATASGTVAGLSVPQGQEIAFDVSVTTNAQGQTVVTFLTPPPTSTSSISANTMQQATEAAREIATAVQQAVFTPPPPGSSAPPSGSVGSGGSNSGETNSSTRNISGDNFNGTTTKTTEPIPPAQIPTNPDSNR